MRENEAAFCGLGNLVLSESLFFNVLCNLFVTMLGCCYAAVISAFFYLLQKDNHFLSSGLAMLLSNWQSPLLYYLSRITKAIIVSHL